MMRNQRRKLYPDLFECFSNLLNMVTKFYYSSNESVNTFVIDVKNNNTRNKIEIDNNKMVIFIKILFNNF